MSDLPKTKFERGGLPTALMDSREAAAYLAVHIQTLYGMVRAGDVPHVRVGKDLRYRVEDLDRWLAERVTTKWEKIGDRGRPVKTSKGAEAHGK